MKYNIPRFIIAGTQSGVGKTTLTLGLLASLKKKGLNVQPFKVGPDYIDPGLHRVAANTFSHNLDSFMGDEKIIKDIFIKYGKEKDIAVIEGVMGLFDGAKGEKEKGSTAHIAKILNCPVILVVNAKGMARSSAALIKGYQNFDKDLNVRGVIFNNVGSLNHQKFLEQVVAEELDIPCLGYLRRNKDLTMPERHLGLVPAPENEALKTQIKSFEQFVGEQIDLDKLIEVASLAPRIEIDNEEIYEFENKVKIGVALDEAFNFYYQDSINFLKELGAEIKCFSPLKDKELPEVDGLYLGGGFPELFLEDLQNNPEMIKSIKEAHKKCLPIYAECGGYMYLLESLEDFKGNAYKGVGLIKGKAKMTNRLAALGYVKGTFINSHLNNEIGIVKGHEFHWSEMSGLEDNYAYTLVGGKGLDNRLEGYYRDNLLASYVHLHLRSNPKFTKAFLKGALDWRKEND